MHRSVRVTFFAQRLGPVSRSFGETASPEMESQAARRKPSTNDVLTDWKSVLRVDHFLPTAQSLWTTGALAG